MMTGVGMVMFGFPLEELSVKFTAFQHVCNKPAHSSFIESSLLSDQCSKMLCEEGAASTNAVLDDKCSSCAYRGPTAW